MLRRVRVAQPANTPGSVLTTLTATSPTPHRCTAIPAASVARMVLQLPTHGPAVVSFRHSPAAGKCFGESDPERSEATRVPIGIMQRSLQTLFNYWNQVRAGRIAPHRLEIEPSRIAGILAETFMLERVEAGTYQFRLAGTRLCELFGSELRGKNFLEGWSEQDRLVLERDLDDDQRAGGGRPSHPRRRHRRPAPRRDRCQLAAATPYRQQDHPHHRRHEPYVSALLARQRAPCAAGISSTIRSSGPMGGRTRSLSGWAGRRHSGRR